MQLPNPMGLLSEAAALPDALAIVTLKVTLVLAIAGLAIALLRRAPASARHRVWSLALAGAVVMPLATALLPAWRVPLPAVPRLATSAALLAPTSATRVGRSPASTAAPVVVGVAA